MMKDFFSLQDKNGNLHQIYGLFCNHSTDSVSCVHLSALYRSSERGLWFESFLYLHDHILSGIEAANQVLRE